MRKTKATIRTIAVEAGVAPNTVSLALRGSTLVSARTRERILKIAKAQAYIPNILAEALRSGKSRTIALIFGNLFNPLFAIKTQKIEHQLRVQGYQVLILNSNENEQQELEVVQTAIGRKVDGVVLCPSMKSREPLEVLKMHGVPCVLVGRNFDDHLEDAVVWDNIRGGRLATEYLLSRGCTNILHIAGPDHVSASKERLQGYRNALADARIPYRESLVVRPSVLAGTYAPVLQALEKEFDGVFAFSDLMLWEAASILLKPPIMVGFDDVLSFFAAPLYYPSIGANLDEETKAVTEMLLTRIEDPSLPPRKVVLPVHFVNRS